jgi:hypothetical protein
MILTTSARSTIGLLSLGLRKRQVVLERLAGIGVFGAIAGTKELLLH